MDRRTALGGMVAAMAGGNLGDQPWPGMGGQGGNPAARPDQLLNARHRTLALPPGAQSGIFRGRLVIITGGLPPLSGLYVYSASGALIGSIAAAVGTGPLGGQVFPVISSYQGVEVSSLLNGQAVFQDTNFTTTPASIGIQGAGITGQQLAISSGIGPEGGGTPGVLVLTDSGVGIGGLAALLFTGATVLTGPLTASSVTIAESAGAGGLLTVTNAASATGSPNVQLTGTGATDNMLGIETGADTNNRLKIDASGKHQWGSGAAGQDTNLYRGAANILQTDDALALSNATVSSPLAGAVLLSGASGAPQITDASGLVRNASGAVLATVPGLTVNGAVFANLATEVLPANDGNVAGGVYRLVAAGFGTWGTAEQLTLQIALGSTGIGSIQIAGAAFASASSVRWNATATFVIASTGSGGTVAGHLDGSMNLTGTALNPGAAANNTLPFNCGQTTAAAFNTTASQTLNIQAEWAGTTGTPSITSQYYYLERIA